MIDSNFKRLLKLLFLGGPAWDVLIIAVDIHQTGMLVWHYWTTVTFWSVGIISIILWKILRHARWR